MKDSIDFGKMDVSKLFVKLLIPTVMGMVFSAIFIITDGIFVGKGIGSDALAAVNITAPLFLINTGVALMFGIGAALATSLGYIIGAAMILVYLIDRKHVIHMVRVKLSRKSLMLTARNVGYMCRLGVSTFLCEGAIRSDWLFSLP